MDYDKPNWIMTNQDGFQQFQMESNNVRWIPKIQNGFQQFKKERSIPIIQKDSKKSS